MSSEHRCMYFCFVTFGVYIDIEKKCNNPRNFSVLIHIGSEKTTIKYKILLGTICVAFFFSFLYSSKTVLYCCNKIFWICATNYFGLIFSIFGRYLTIWTFHFTLESRKIASPHPRLLIFQFFSTQDIFIPTPPSYY